MLLLEFMCNLFYFFFFLNQLNVWVHIHKYSDAWQKHNTAMCDIIICAENISLKNIINYQYIVTSLEGIFPHQFLICVFLIIIYH